MNNFLETMHQMQRDIARIKSTHGREFNLHIIVSPEMIQCAYHHVSLVMSENNEILGYPFTVDQDLPVEFIVMPQADFERALSVKNRAVNKKIERMRVETCSENESFMLIVDFKDINYGVTFKEGDTQTQVAAQLHCLAERITRHKNL